MGIGPVIQNCREEDWFATFQVGAFILAGILTLANIYSSNRQEAQFQEELNRRPIIYSPRSTWQAEANYRRQMDQYCKAQTSAQNPR